MRFSWIDFIVPSRLTAYLGDYRIQAQSHEFSSPKQTASGCGRATLAAAKELPADLLVMGAYGENALSTLFGLGRATQKNCDRCANTVTHPALNLVSRGNRLRLAC